MGKRRAGVVRLCRVHECGRSHEVYGWCNMHFRRWRRAHRDLRMRTISGAHRDVIKVYGRAAEWPCVDCGEQACDWSYQFGDPNELLDPYGRPYSLDGSYYKPRCRPCHKRYDLTATRPSPPEPPVVHWQPEVGAF